MTNHSLNPKSKILGSKQILNHTSQTQNIDIFLIFGLSGIVLDFPHFEFV